MEPSSYFVRESKFSALPNSHPHQLLPQYKLGVQNMRCADPEVEQGVRTPLKYSKLTSY